MASKLPLFDKSFQTIRSDGIKQTTTIVLYFGG